MSAVLKQSPQSSGVSTPDDPSRRDLLTDAAQAFLAGLHRRFEARRQALLATCSTSPTAMPAGR
ncbi:MAG: hypothetical protein ACR2J7_05935 [Luteimonas sp.]